MEHSYGNFERPFRLPSRLLADKIDAKSRNGVLSLTLPRSEAARAKEIPIKIS